MKNDQLGFTHSNSFLFYDLHYKSPFKLFMSKYSKFGLRCPNYSVQKDDEQVIFKIEFSNITHTVKIPDNISVRILYTNVANIFKIENYKFKIYIEVKERDIYLERGDFFRRYKNYFLNFFKDI